MVWFAIDLLAAPVREVVQHGRRIVVGDRDHRPLVPAADAADALQRSVRLAPAAMRGQLGVEVEFDQLGVGLNFFLSLDVLGLGRQWRAAVCCGLAAVVREFPRAGQRHVRVAAERQPSDLAGALVAVGEGERLDASRCDPDAEAGTGGIADGVLFGVRLVGPDAGVGELGFHDVVSQGLLLARLTKMAIHYGTRRDDKTRSRHVS